MRSTNRFLFVTLILLAGCGSPATVTAIPTSSPEPTLPEPTSLPPTAEETPTLTAGQWTYIFYHEGLEQVVLVNGGPERGKPADDPLELWGWDGREWSLLRADPNGPVWRNWPAVAYDSARDVLVIHGGLQTGKSFDETWEWDGEMWTLFTEPGPGAREGALMAYDAAREKTILFGGSSPDLAIHGDTWEWDGQGWTRVS